MNKGVLIILLAICAVILGISAYKLITYYGADRAAESEFAELLPEEIGGADIIVGDDNSMSYENLLPYYKSLREENGDMVGWLRIPGTRVSYPVMYTPNSPEYYLDKNFKKQYSANGSLFVSSINDIDLPSDVVTIYGHRMKTGSMFGSLGDFLEDGFMEKHDTIIVDTFEKRNEYKVFSAFSLAVGTGYDFDYYNYNNFFDKVMFDDFMARMNSIEQVSLAKYAPMYGEKILLLSTCEYTHENGRLVLAAVQVS